MRSGGKSSEAAKSPHESQIGLGNISRYESSRNRVPCHRSQQHTPPNLLLPRNNWFFLFLLDGAWTGGEAILVGTLTPTIVWFALVMGVRAIEREVATFMAPHAGIGF